MANPLVPVRIGVCLCPDAPHADGDFVYLRPILDLRGGFRVKRRVIDLNRAAQIRSLQAAYAAGTSVELLAKQNDMDVADMRDILENKGELAGLMASDQADLEINLAEAYLYEGVVDWNLVDEDGAARAVTADNLRSFLFNDYGRAEAAADKADDLYRPAVLDPLFQRALSSLPATSVKPSISPTSGNGQRRPKRSKRSSTSTSPTAGTVPIT